MKKIFLLMFAAICFAACGGDENSIPGSISWQKNDGAIVPLINQEVTFKRNIKTTITVKVNDSSVNQGLNITEEKNELQPGENIVLESSGAGNTPVNPSAN